MNVADVRRRHAGASANEEFGEDEVGVLLAEIDRLRDLIKEAEWSDYAEVLGGDEGVCPWCGAFKCDGDRHVDDCAAFTPEGCVR